MRRLGLITTLILIQTGLAQSAPGPTRVFDLRTAKHAKLIGAEDNDFTRQVARAGDVNGDQIPDLLVGGASDVGSKAGTVYVVFGPLERNEKVDLGELGNRGFEIRGTLPGDFSHNPFPAGDVNGDGLDDVLVSSSGSSYERNKSGKVYVVFGKQNTLPVELALFDSNSQGTLGYRIDGPHSFALAGYPADALGDLNHDGLSDVVIGAAFTGSSYVVFGKQDPAPIDLALFDASFQGDLGYRIDQPFPPHSSQRPQVAAGGDVNGDGTPDVVVSYTRGAQKPGRTWVVFGKGSPAPVDVRDLGSHGFKIIGSTAVTLAAAGVGDMNKDGLAEVAITGKVGDFYARPHTAASVVFGKRGTKTVDLRNLGRRGFWIRSANSFPITIAAGGDVNGDGRADVLLGDPYASSEGREEAGSVWAIFGKKGTARIKLWVLGDRGFRLNGEYGCETRRCASDNLGLKLAGPGDINGDGYADILSGADSPDNNFRGKAHLFWGRP